MASLRCVVFAALAACTFFGCGGGGKTMVPAVDDPNCTMNFVSIGFKTPPGYTASMGLTTTSNCFATATYSTKAGTAVLAGPPFTGDPSNPDPTVKVWLYLSFQFDTLEYLAGLPDVNVCVPPSVAVPGRTFHLAFDQNDINPPFVWNPDPNYGTATPYGCALTFVQDPAVRLSINPNAFYQFAVYSTGT